MTDVNNFNELIETTPCRYGVMSYFKSDQVIGTSLREYGEWAQQEIEFLLRLLQKGDTVLDVGAYIGTHTLAFASLVEKTGVVVAIEPNPCSFKLLTLNVDANRLANVKLEFSAISNKDGVLQLPDSCIELPTNPAGTSLLSKETSYVAADSSSLVHVPVKCLDQFELSACALIKVDVEGMETMVLEGAQKLLQKHRPLVYAECLSVANGATMHDFMTSLEYTGFLHCELAYNPANFKGNPRNIFGMAREANIIFVPNEKLHEFNKRVDRHVELTPLNTLDDLVLGMLRKPQYKQEVLAQTQAATLIGNDFWLNLPEQRYFENELAKRTTEIKDLQSALNSKEIYIKDIENKYNSEVSNLKEKLDIEIANKEQKLLKIIVPFYKNEDLVETVVGGIISCKDELPESRTRFFFINDSPDHSPLRDALTIWASRLRELGIDGDVVENDSNLGFIKSVNRGLSSACSEGADVLLLNSDAIMFPGCVNEMLVGASIDDMVGFVCPRSNDAGISTLPHVESDKKNMSASDCYASYEIIARHLPRFSFVPTAVGFCLLIKWKIIAECGLFDEVYGKGYNEENDLIMRANRYGYRVIFANKAYCWHKGSASFGKSTYLSSDAENAKILNNRYPEYTKLVSEYYDSSQHKTENILAGLISGYDKGRINIALNLSNIGPNYNGTSEVAINLARAISLSRADVTLHFIVDQKTAEFHGFGRFGYINAPNSDRRYSAVLHIGQPFKWSDIEVAARSAPVNAFYMLDSIAQDCGYLRSNEVEKIWHFVSRNSDGIFYISNYSKRIYNNRYNVASDTRQYVTLLPTASEEYRRTTPKEGRHILVIGNHFRHKAIPECVEILNAAFPSKNIVVLGTESGRYFHNVTFMKSGMISEDVVENLYACAEVVVFPSHYEGFGFPLVKGVAYKKPVIVRDTELVDELIEYLPHGAIVQKFRMLDEVPGCIEKVLRQPICSFIPSRDEVTWEIVANQVVDGILEMISNIGDGSRIVGRLEQIALMGQLSVNARDGETLEDIYNSRSWRLTRPLRLANKFVQDSFRWWRSIMSPRNRKDF